MHPGRTKAPLSWFAAFGSVVLGHWLAYLVSIPGADAREALLAQTGHGYWPTAVAVAVVFGVAAFLGTVVRHVRLGALAATSPPAPWERYRSTALKLAALQASIFVVQEVVERLQAGTPIGGLLHGRFLVVGLAVQILLAAAVAIALVVVARAARAVGRALSGDADLRREQLRFVLPQDITLVRRSFGRSRLARGPPSLIAATR
jgi:hypothetical protein